MLNEGVFNEDFCGKLLELPEYQKKQLALFLISSTLNTMSLEHIQEFINKVNK